MVVDCSWICEQSVGVATREWLWTQVHRDCTPVAGPRERDAVKWETKGVYMWDVEGGATKGGSHVVFLLFFGCFSAEFRQILLFWNWLSFAYFTPNYVFLESIFINFFFGCSKNAISMRIA